MQNSQDVLTEACMPPGKLPARKMRVRTWEWQNFIARWMFDWETLCRSWEPNEYREHFTLATMPVGGSTGTGSGLGPGHHYSALLPGIVAVSSNWKRCSRRPHGWKELMISRRSSRVVKEFRGRIGSACGMERFER